MTWIKIRLLIKIFMINVEPIKILFINQNNSVATMVNCKSYKWYLYKNDSRKQWKFNKGKKYNYWFNI